MGVSILHAQPCSPALEIILSPLRHCIGQKCREKWEFFSVKCDLIFGGRDREKKQIDLVPVHLPYAGGALVCTCEVTEVEGCEA